METNTNLLNVVNRNCIICNSTEYNSIFTLSDDYNNFFDNSNKDSVKLNSIYGPQKIVECKNCGCCYVKNVVMGITTNSNELHERENEEREKCILEENKLHVENLIKKKFYDPILYKLNNAIRFSKKNPEDMFFFDYGSGTVYVNKLSEILGFKRAICSISNLICSPPEKPKLTYLFNISSLIFKSCATFRKYLMKSR